MVPSPHVFVARSCDPLERLDKVVVSRLTEIGETVSRSAVQRWIDAGRVLVDGVPRPPSARVMAGAEILVDPLRSPSATLEPDASVPFVVVFEDEHLLVVDKPAGVVVHPARGHAEGTLVHGLLARGSFDRFSSAAEGAGAIDRSRPGIVHRLDKGTSGILVVAKDDPTREGLKLLFSRHSIERKYLAIASGRATSRTYDTLHGRHPKDRLKFTSRVREGKRAVTRVRAIEVLGAGAATLVSCELETGRTHQIRVHLSEASKTPVLGDPMYGASLQAPEIQRIAERLGHQALHAAVLGFSHPRTGEWLRFEREPPADFTWALTELRGLIVDSRS